MKIQCNVCEAAEATVLCCADEAALCSECDEKIHNANKLAGKHQRVPLASSSSNMPKCDICQDTVGYFFCLEDRALLCRKCDIAIHSANSYVSNHQRFLLTGVKVGLEGTTEMVGGPSSASKSLSVEKRPETKSHTVSKRDALMLSVDEYKISSVDVRVGRDIPPSKVSYTGGSATECFPQWNVDEYMGMADINSGYDYMGNGGSSKADSGKLGESGSPALRLDGEDLDGDEYSSQVPEASWTVPQISSPPTASGLYWPRDSYRSSDFAAFVPDVCYTEMQNQSSDTLSKRRRQF